jgi:hypothetical protein
MGLLTTLVENKLGGDGNMITEAQESRRALRQQIITEAGQLYESMSYQGQPLTQRWPKLFEDFESPNEEQNWRAALTMYAVENTRRLHENHIRLYGEAVVQASLGALNPRVLDVVRIFYPNQIAPDLVDIQPLNGQNGQIFTMKPRYGGPTAGVPGVTVGNQMFIPSTYPTNSNYAAEGAFQNIGTGTGAIATFTGNLVPTPVRPNSVSVTNVGSTVVAADDGNGNLTGTGISSGTINYATGAISVTYSSNPASGVITAAWQYSSESGENNIRTVEFDLSLTPVTAKIHPLQYKYSVAAGLAASAHLAIDVQDVLVNTAATYLKIERDNNIVNLITSNANADTTLNFNCDMTGKNVRQEVSNIITQIAA